MKFQDDEIEGLLSRPKLLPERWERRLLNLRFKREVSQKRSDLIVRESDSDFRIFVRQSTINHSDFSVIVGYRRKQDASWFKLRRYNGKHPTPHRNNLETPKETIFGFHIYTATVRYQQLGITEEGYAVATAAYVDVYSAIAFALDDSNFEKPQGQPANPNQLVLLK